MADSSGADSRIGVSTILSACRGARQRGTADGQSALRELAAKAGDGAVVRRLLGIALILDGYQREAAARLSGMDRQTLRTGCIALMPTAWLD
jgi:hypothetical protein